jgi:hypothetical protein
MSRRRRPNDNQPSAAADEDAALNAAVANVNARLASLSASLTDAEPRVASADANGRLCQCTGCNQMLLKSAFSSTQWNRRAQGTQVCKNCALEKMNAHRLMQLTGQTDVTKAMNRLSLAEAGAGAGAIAIKVPAASISRAAADLGMIEVSPGTDLELRFRTAAGVCITVYPSTGVLRCDIDHPKRGKNALWRSDPYSSLDELIEFFKDPRKHSGTGYRRTGDALCQCTGCYRVLTHTPNFSANQWSKRNQGSQRCRDCAVGKSSSSHRETDDDRAEQAAAERAMQQLHIKAEAGEGARTGARTGPGARTGAGAGAGPEASPADITQALGHLSLEAGDAQCVCVGCNRSLPVSTRFSRNQLARRAQGGALCRACAAGKSARDRAARDAVGVLGAEPAMQQLSLETGVGAEAGAGAAIPQAMERLPLDGVGNPPPHRAGGRGSRPPRGGAGPGYATITTGNLEKHEMLSGDVERRQFNCPRHAPAQLAFLFFKKVPRHKPVASCPRCKGGGGGGGGRLVAVPKSEERGYGMFRCRECRSSWGSARACPSLGQFCQTPSCSQSAGEVPIFPFRLEPVRHKPREGGRKPMGSSPSVPEDEAVSHGMEGLNMGAGGFGDPFAGGGAADAPPLPPPGPGHRCTGCAEGACNRRFPPASAQHASSGSTASTCSGRTFSTIDLSQFKDRDGDDDSSNQY